MKLLHGDCLDLMKDIPEKSIDMILCDLPYGTTVCKWDNVIPFEPLWEQYTRVIKDNGAIVLFSQLPFGAKLINSQPKLFRYEWIWDKVAPAGFLNAKKMPLRSHENIFVFYKKLPTYNPQMRTEFEPYKKKRGASKTGIYPTHQEISRCSAGERHPVDVLCFNSQAKEVSNAKRLHPTQKPVALLEYLIKTYTNPGETVLDNCMGSGSTGEACLNTKRHFIGIEKDAKYFEIACKRLEETQKRLEAS